MRVIIIVDNLDLTMGGGVGSFIYDLSCALKEKGTDLSLISIIRNSNEADEMKTDLESRGIPVCCAGARGRKDAFIHFPRYVKKLRKLIRSFAGEEQTVCSLHLKVGVLYGAIATIGMDNVKCAETYHSNYSHYWVEYKLLSKRMDLYIACSESARDEFAARFSPKPERLTAIPNGIRCIEIRERAARGKGKEKHGFQILSAGRFTDQKNFHATAKAFASLQGDVCYRIIGEGDGEEKIRAACAGSWVVEIEGTMARNDLLAEVRRSDIAVMPSLWEGLSIFLLEVIAVGTPLMLSDIPSFRNIFHEEALGPGEEWRCCPWGFLVRTNNVNAYREAIEYCRAKPELRGPMKAALTRYAEENDMSICARRYTEVFESIAQGRKENGTTHDEYRET